VIDIARESPRSINDVAVASPDAGRIRAPLKAIDRLHETRRES
jgi:hypothetical protein